MYKNYPGLMTKMGNLCSCSRPRKSVVHECRELLSKLRLLDNEDADEFNHRLQIAISQPADTRGRALTLLKQQLENCVRNNEFKYHFG